MNDPQTTVFSTPTIDPNARSGSLRPANAIPPSPNLALVYPKTAGDLD
jgi:osomolarity two-component system response regulator SKN7